MESNLVSQIYGTLKSLEEYHQLSFIRNNTGQAKMHGCFIRFGKEGSSDFIIFIKVGITLFVECKDIGKKQDKKGKQKVFRERIESLGFEYFLIDNYADFQRLIFHKCHIAI